MVKYNESVITVNHGGSFIKPTIWNDTNFNYNYSFDTNSFTALDKEPVMVKVVPATVRVKAGYLAQIFNGDDIIWESNKAYKTKDKAWKAADNRIKNKIEKFFN